MPVIKHTHDEDCRWGDTISGYLCDRALDVLWYNIQDVGDWQGSVYGVGEYKGKILVYEDSYGSCSGCGAWGEGGEPADQKEILSKSKLFDDAEVAKKYVIKEMDKYDSPDIKKMMEAIDEIRKNKK